MKAVTRWAGPHFYFEGNLGKELVKHAQGVVPRELLSGQVPSSTHGVPGSLSWCVMTTWNVISHVSISFPEYLLLIFSEKPAVRMKVRQEIALESLRPLWFWSIPSTSHRRIKSFKLPFGKIDRTAGLPQSALAQLPVCRAYGRN